MADRSDSDRSPDLPHPLAGLRVLECGDTIAAAYAGRLLRQLGADVAKVEVGAGDPLRTRGPFLATGPDGRPDPDASTSFAYFHADKRSVRGELGTSPGRARLRQLATGADVVFRSTRNARPWLVDDDLALVEAANPGLITVDITPFGATGPRAGLPGTDLVALAAGGLLSLQSTDRHDPDAAPLRPYGDLSSFHAATHATVAVLGALHARLGDGQGQRIDVSVQEVVAGILLNAVPSWTYAGIVPSSHGARVINPWSVFRCRDGFVLMHCTEDAHWQQLVEILGRPDWALAELFDTNAGRVQAGDGLEGLVAEALTTFEVEDFLAQGIARGVPCARINTAEDLLADAHLRERAFFETPHTGAGNPTAERSGSDGGFVAPGLPFRLHRTALVTGGRAPRLGEHTAAVRAEWSPRPRTTPASPVTASVPVPPATAPLAGIKVVDLSWVWAGPYCAQQFAHLGADVVKVESPNRLDLTRRIGPFVDNVPGLNRSGFFNQYNQGKRSACLDLKDADERARLVQLLAGADVVIDNWSAGALAKAGFSYDQLRRLNPAIVAVSITGFGETGPMHRRISYGAGIEALCGTSSLTGAPGGPPADSTLNLPDANGGIHAALASLAALYRARRSASGHGDRVELSLLEAAVAVLPWGLLEVAAHGHQPERCGNRDPDMVPHGVFRAADGAWVALATRDDADFASLAQVVDRPDLAADPRYRTLGGRRAHEDDLETVVAAWVTTQDAGRIATTLQRAGVPAHRVDDVADLVGSNHLDDRSYFSRADHPECGPRPLASAPWRASRSPMRTAAPAPLFGQHTAHVLAELDPPNPPRHLPQPI